MTSPDYPDFATPQAHATAISTTGTPLLHGAGIIVDNQAVAVPASGFTSPFAVFTKPGYVISLSAASAGTPATPFMRVSVFWWLHVNGTVRVDEEVWIVPVTNSGAAALVVSGKGPTRGAAATFQFHNYDAAQALTVTWSLLETTQHIARDDWRSDPVPAAGVGTLVGAGGDAWANILAGENGVNIPVSGSHARLLPLYAGQAIFTLLMNAAVNLTTTFTCQDPDAGNPIVYQNNGSSALVQGPLTVNLPRVPVLLNLGNPGTVADNVSWALIPVEFAS